ncbi:hypothetical protein GIJ48_08945 [Escherichia coli]|nr:hypothetical protein [Escherichia coli]
MDYFLTLIKDNKEAVGFIVIISGGIGFFLNYFLARKKIKEDKKALRQQMITNNIAPMRQEWINDVRKSAADLLSSVHFMVVYQGNDEETKELLKDRYKDETTSYQLKRTYLDLMLPSKKDGNDESEAENVRLKLEEINNHLNKKSILTTDQVRKKIEECKNLIKILLKKEWDETKSLREIGDKPNTKKN